MNDDKDIFTFVEFDGLRNTVEAESMSFSDLVAATNVDVTDAKRLRRRKGFGAPVVSGPCHSFWSDGMLALVVADNALKAINPDYSTTTLRTGLAHGAALEYAAVGNRVFFSSDYDNGVFQDGQVRGWGISIPALPTVAVGTGQLPAGRYQYVTTFVRDDGQESGAPRAGTIDLATPSGLLFSGFGVPPAGIESINLYLSPPDGDALYLATTIPAAATAAIVITQPDAVHPIPTQFLSPPPVGAHIAYAGGRTWVAVGSRVYYSEPAAPELFDLRKHYQFEARVTMLATLEDGIYIGTETEVGWVAGADPAKSEYIQKTTYGAIPGTLAVGNVDDYGPTSGGKVLYFATLGGLMRGTSGGALENLTRARYRYPAATRGAGIVRDTGGTLQYLAILQG